MQLQCIVLEVKDQLDFSALSPDIDCNKSFCDCEITNGSKTFKAHKLVLSRLSPIFRKSFSDESFQKQSSFTIVNSKTSKPITDEALRIFFLFIYGSPNDRYKLFSVNLNASADHLHELMLVCHYYEMDLFFKYFDNKVSDLECLLSMKSLQATLNLLIQLDLKNSVKKLRDGAVENIIGYQCYTQKVTFDFNFHSDCGVEICMQALYGNRMISKDTSRTDPQLSFTP